jgi:hypothetical protein
MRYFFDSLTLFVYLISTSLYSTLPPPLLSFPTSSLYPYPSHLYLTSSLIPLSTPRSPLPLLYLISSSSLPHLLLIATSSLPHLLLISTSSPPHRYLIATSSPPHRYLISTSSPPHRYLISTSSPPHLLLIATSSLPLGESFGGVIAQIFTSQHPDRVSSMVLLSSLAKTALPPNIEWKARNLLSILELLGAYVCTVWSHPTS